MNELIKRVEQYISSQHLIETGDVVIAGVSGGADSMCLLEVLRACQADMGYDLRVIHVEHGIRGAESLDDAAYVDCYCRSRQIPCKIVHVDA